jgi:hypothetical protein
VIIADRREKAELDNNAEHMGRDIGAAGVVAEIFREFFFVAVWSREARFNRHPRHGETRPDTTIIVRTEGR